MRVGILEAGAPPANFVPAFGTYADMTRRLLGDSHDVETIRVFEAAALPVPGAFDGYVVTGSAAGAYDPLPWIPPLEDFLRAARGRAKLVGICFGHQILAQAFGGFVAKAPQGWGLGLHRYEICATAPWLDDGPAAVVGTASHQDQVLVPPPGSRTLAASAFTPHAVLAIGDDAFSVQFHPEFVPAFSRALFARRQETALPPDLSRAQVAGAIASLDAPNDNVRVADWIDRFLRL